MSDDLKQLAEKAREVADWADRAHSTPQTRLLRQVANEIGRLRDERDDLARALFKIRSLTIRGCDHRIGGIACDAVRHIDETPLFPAMVAKLEATKGHLRYHDDPFYKEQPLGGASTAADDPSQE